MIFSQKKANVRYETIAFPDNEPQSRNKNVIDKAIDDHDIPTLGILKMLPLSGSTCLVYIDRSSFHLPPSNLIRCMFFFISSNGRG